MSSLFHSSGLLTRFNFRKDRFKLLVWIIVLIALMVMIAWKFGDIYGSSTAIKTLMPTLKSKAMVSLFGTLGYPNSVTMTTARVFAQEMVIFMSIVTVVMNYSLAISGTRGEEDLGVTEIIRAKTVGKLSPLTAQIIELVTINFVLGVAYSVGLQFANMSGSDSQGDWIIGLSLGFIGIMFASFALLMAQVADHANNAMILSYLGFAVAYIIRMVTDVSNPDFTWWSPIGWIEKTSPYQNNNWAPIVLMVVLSVIFIGLAYVANLHRDLGSGIISTRPGKRGASVWLQGPVSLLLRLQRTTIIAWIVGVLALAVSYGSVFNSIGDVLKTNPTMQKVFGSAAVHSANHTLILNFIATIGMVLAILAVVPGIQIIFKLKSDESKGWLEILHSKPLSRTRMLLGYMFVALILGVGLLAIGVYSLIGTGNAMLSPAQQLNAGRVGTQLFLTYIPAILIMVGLAVVLVGWLPRLTSVLWLYTAVGFIILYMGGLLKLPGWTKKVIPFGWVNKVPVKEMDWNVFWLMILLAIVLFIIGWLGYKRRDLEID